MSSWDCFSAIALSRGANRAEQCGTTQARTLTAPIKDFMPPTLLGGLQEDSVEKR